MIGQDAVYGLAALVDEGTEACAKNSNHARIAAHASANVIAQAATSNAVRIAAGVLATSTRTMHDGKCGMASGPAKAVAIG